MRIDSSGRLLVGTSSAIASANNSGGNVLCLNGSQTFFRSSSDANSQYIEFVKERASGTVVSSGDRLGQILFEGHDGSNPIKAVQITATVDGTPGSNDMPGRLVFSTTADGASSPTERLRINSSGRVGIGTSSPAKLTHISNSYSAPTGGHNVETFLLVSNGAVNGNACGIEIQSGRSGASFIDFGDTDNADQGRITYSNSANTLAHTVNGSVAHFINSSGHVGIGTTSPVSILDVTVGASGARKFVANYDNSVITIKGSNASSNPETFRVIGDNIRFNTGISGSGTERMRIDSSGRLNIGATSNSYTGANLQVDASVGSFFVTQNSHILLQNKNSSTTNWWNIAPRDDGNLTIGNGAPGSTGVHTDRKVTIDSTGNFLVAKTSENLATAGFQVRADAPGLTQITRNSASVLHLNRLGNDGVIVSIRQATTEEGTISVSGNTVSYNQFLGSHWAALTDWSRPEIKIGTILETINELTDWKYAAIEVEGEQKKICYNGTAAAGDTVSVEYEGEIYEGIVELETDPEFNKAVKVKVNDTAASKAIYGVFVGWNNDSDLDGGIWNDMYVGAVGNYVIRMAARQDPDIGDLVESNAPGCGVVQDDDIIRTKTVAKITTTIPQVTYDDGSFLVTCVLYCG